jgi:tetratricopeptide (TPR) repeat protein
MGLVYAAIGEHESAVEQFRKATAIDQYLAVACVPLLLLFIVCTEMPLLNPRYFQCGVSNFLLERYELALLDFEEAYLYLRGNTTMYVLQHHKHVQLLTLTHLP